MRNIINDAESEDIAKAEQRKLEQEKRRIEEAQVASKLKIRIDADDYAVASESEIVPSDLHPQPPRRAKSLIHLFVPSEDYYYCPKELFFENETPYTSTEGSDSLLSASKCPPESINASHCKKISELKSRSKRNSVSRTSIKRSESFRHLMEAEESLHYTTRVNVTETRQSKSKSLDRIDDGLDSMVDIVMMNQSLDVNNDSSKATSLVKSVSNVYIKSGMFLPADTSCYFPRMQERKAVSAGFVIKRGHGNAGMYSGQLQGEGRSTLSRNKEFFSLGSGSGGGKVTDLPSGLY